jgi:hypothetical protein
LIALLAAGYEPVLRTEDVEITGGGVSAPTDTPGDAWPLTPPWRFRGRVNDASHGRLACTC